jgi:hypothetical protein
MITKRTLIIVCGVLGFMVITVLAAVLFFFRHVSMDLTGAAVVVNAPADVVVGQTFDLQITVKNERSSKILQLSDVDIGEAYLAGFSIASVKPAPKSNTHVPVDNSRSFTFAVPIQPGATQTFVYTLRAEKSGVYRGDVDVCEGLQFITTMAQTVVKAKE